MSNQSQQLSHSSGVSFNSNLNSQLSPSRNQVIGEMRIENQSAIESTSGSSQTSSQTSSGSMDSTQLETVINNYNRILTQLPYNRNNQYNDWMQSFYNMMKSEWTRLRSFYARNDCKWALDYVTPEELANAGFFFLNGDRVQCAFCRGIVSNWERGDRPLTEHARHFPRCPFIMEEDVGNQPINDDPIRGIKNRMVAGHDVCGNFTPSQLNSIVINNRNDSSIDMREYGVQPHRGPKHSNYNSIDSRIRSYLTNGWDPRVPVGIDSLSEAGFFAIGMSDYVKCFYCDGGLCNWELGDDPWIEHAKWFPDCQFVQLNKSQAFIDACKKIADKERAKHNASDVESDVYSNMGSDTEDFDNDVLGIRAVNEWMNSNIVKQLVDLDAFSVEIIKAVLNRRWRLTKQPFSSFSELYDAVTQWRNEPTNQLTLTSATPQRQVSSESNVSSDEDYHSGSELPSSQSSISSTTSTISTMSSSPEPPKEIRNEFPKSVENPFTCKICYEREIGVVFLPCGHQLACTQCAACVTDCPICRKVIRGTVRTFFS